jgi:hypothetical protein
VADAGCRIGALLALDAVLGEFAARLADIAMGRDLERQLGAARVLALGSAMVKTPIFEAK